MPVPFLRDCAAGFGGAADKRRNLTRAEDCETRGVWLVTVDGVTIASVRPKPPASEQFVP